MLRIFGRTTLVSQFMVRSEMRFRASTAIYGGPGLARQAGDSWFGHDLFGKPASTPHQVRGRLFPDHAPASFHVIVAYSAACLAPRTPCARAATRSATAGTVLAVARPSASRLPRKASTSAVPTTAPLAISAIARAASGVR